MNKTQYEKILQEMKRAGKRGRTYHELYVVSNCPWKRLRELEAMGVRFVWGKDDKDARLTRVWLKDTKQKRIAELLEHYKRSRKAA